MQNINRHTAHPWHGISAGEAYPQVVNAFIEIVPTDTVKFEIDKASGFLKVDRPQRFSNVVPCLYGFVPQTYCGESVAEYCRQHTSLSVKSGDGDPLDICVFTERPIAHGNILMQVRPIGGIRLIDKGEADDKIISVFLHDEVYTAWNDISDCPESVLNRLKHYFLTYKNIPGTGQPTCVIDGVYGHQQAYEVIRRSVKDYAQSFQK